MKKIFETVADLFWPRWRCPASYDGKDIHSLFPARTGPGWECRRCGHFTLF